MDEELEISLDRMFHLLAIPKIVLESKLSIVVALSYIIHVYFTRLLKVLQSLRFTEPIRPVKSITIPCCSVKLTSYPMCNAGRRDGAI